MSKHLLRSARSFPVRQLNLLECFRALEDTPTLQSLGEVEHGFARAFVAPVNVDRLFGGL